MSEKVIGLVYRFGKNDYQINLMETDEHDQDLLMKIMDKYDNDCSAERGDDRLSIKDANVEWFERSWATKEAEAKRKELAHKVYKEAVEGDWNFYDDHEGTHWTEDDIYASLETAKESAYSVETLIQFYDGTEETKKYYDAAMDIIHYMEWYQEVED